ncbi:MAG: chromate transporter [Clostridia bacterium]|nr:chromate transporter [Clostridia bacterium]
MEGKNRKVSLWTLFITFCQLGGLTFGGGYAMLPMLQKEVVEKKKWATEEELLDYYAVGQCTPGIIAVNTATFIGYKTRGIIGGIVATAGVVAPSFLIILVIAALIKNFADNTYVIHALAGIKVAVCALVLNSVISLWKKGVKDILGIILFVIVFAIMLIFKISSIWLVIAAIVFGIVYGRFAPKKEVRK